MNARMRVPLCVRQRERRLEPVGWQLVGVTVAAIVAAGIPACSGGDARLGVAVAPSGAQVLRDSSRLLDITLTRDAAITADVEVSLADPPPGVSADIVTFSGPIANAAMKISVGADVPLGSLELTVVATGGGATIEVPLMLDVLAAEPSSQELIAAALAAGQIDLKTSLLYRSYARFGDDRLPVELRGSGTEEDLILPRDITQAEPQLPAEALAALRPYLVRPDHPESIYASVEARREPRARSAALAPASAPEECSGQNAWRSKHSKSIPVRVWTECGGATAGDLEDRSQVYMLDHVLGMLDTMWPAMTDLMGVPRPDAGGPDEGGDDAIDVYLVQGSITRGGEVHDAATIIGLGLRAYAKQSPSFETNSFGCSISSGYIIMPRSAALGEGMHGTLSHELFHVLQFAHNGDVLGDAAGLWWFVEASATWALCHFDRTLPWPHRMAAPEHLGRFGRYQHEEIGLMARVPVVHSYAAYIWPLFVEQELGSADIIGSFWTALEKDGTPTEGTETLEQSYSFTQAFHTFALRNLNASFVPGDPLPRTQRYVDLDPVFPDELVKPVTSVLALEPGTVSTQALDMPPLSAAYFLLRPTGGDIAKVEIDLTGLQPAGALDVDALIRTPDGWLAHPVSFTGEQKVVFCFDKGPTSETVRGAFDSLELVLSNHAHAIDGRVAGALRVIPTSAPCGVWSGTTTSTTTGSDAAGTTTETIQTTITLEYDDQNGGGGGVIPYRLRTGSFTYDRQFQSVDRVPPCQSHETGGGPMSPGMPGDMQPGATFASLYLFTTSQPATYMGGGQSWATITQTTSCNAANMDVTTSSLGFIQWWSTPGIGPFEVSADGGTIAGAADVDQGTQQLHYGWNLMKLDE